MHIYSAVGGCRKPKFGGCEFPALPLFGFVSDVGGKYPNESTGGITWGGKYPSVCRMDEVGGNSASDAGLLVDTTGEVFAKLFVGGGKNSIGSGIGLSGPMQFGGIPVVGGWHLQYG